MKRGTPAVFCRQCEIIFDPTRPPARARYLRFVETHLLCNAPDTFIIDDQDWLRFCGLTMADHNQDKETTP